MGQHNGEVAGVQAFAPKCCRRCIVSVFEIIRAVQLHHGGSSALREPFCEVLLRAAGADGSTVRGRHFLRDNVQQREQEINPVFSYIRKNAFKRQ
jgi:hypothetical protein